MKKVILAIVTLGIFVVIIVGVRKYRMVPYEADCYIQDKKERLESLANKQVDSLFVHNHTDIFPIYTKCNSRYIKDNFWKQTGTAFRNELWDWNYEDRLPKDIVSTYHVAPENPNYFVFGKDVIEDIKTQIRLNNVDNDNNSRIRGLNQKGIWQTRWALGANENWGNGTIVQYIIVPYAVSFRKQSYGLVESFVSVDEALDNAYEFYTENEKSDLKRNIVSDTRYFTNGPIINNDYYSLVEDSDASFVPTTITNSPAYEHWMYNDLFYVFVRAYGQKIYKLKLQDRHVEFEKEKYITTHSELIFKYGFISIGVLITIWFVFFIWVIWEIRQTKLTILQRIISKCNPQKFVKNYDGEKVKSANDIYSKAINIKESDEVAIKELASRAENELCIHLVSPREIKALKELCNPKKFMQPYDPEKVKRANVLFGKLNKEYVSYSEYTEIKEDIDKLYKKMQNSQGL